MNAPQEKRLNFILHTTDSCSLEQPQAALNRGTVGGGVVLSRAITWRGAGASGLCLSRSICFADISGINADYYRLAGAAWKRVPENAGNGGKKATSERAISREDPQHTLGLSRQRMRRAVSG
jgi:hypothetical protein